jgi:7-carboxy-7-deazaguanine synthase
MATDEKKARLVEIFSSLQGEGLRVGERMTFVRFEACDLKCRWCDTPESFAVHKNFRIEKIPFSGTWENDENPVSGGEIEKWLRLFSDPMVSLTGGEPLQQVEFLESWLPEVSQKHRFLLETNGVLPEALRRVLPWIHTVSMDIKLPSSAKTGVFWKEHESFLRLAIQGKECYVKIVVTEETLEEDLNRALELILSIDSRIPVILQPASETKSFRAIPTAARLGEFYDLARIRLKEVRVIPQTHKMLGIL